MTDWLADCWDELIFLRTSSSPARMTSEDREGMTFERSLQPTTGHLPKAIVIIPMTTLRDAIIRKAAIVQFLEFGHTLTLRMVTTHTHWMRCLKTRINTSFARSILCLSYSRFHSSLIITTNVPIPSRTLSRYLSGNDTSRSVSSVEPPDHNWLIMILRPWRSVACWSGCLKETRTPQLRKKK